MKRPASNLKRTILAVPAAALMLGAAEAGTTVGLNFQTWYYDSGNTLQTIGFNNGYSAYNTTGMPVTAKAFGLNPADWFNTDPMYGNPNGGGNPINQACTFGGTATNFAGSLSCHVNSPKGGFQSGSGCKFASGITYPGYAPGVFCPQGEDELLWGIIVGNDANPFTVSVSGLAAKFPNGYVIQSMAAHGGYSTWTGLPSVDFTDGTTTATAAYHTWVINNDPAAQWLTATAGISDPSGVFTADTIYIKSRADGTGLDSTLAGLIITDKPVVTSCRPATTNLISGQSFTLTATAIGLGTLTYQWKHDGTNVGTNSPTYTVSTSSQADSGSYTLTVTSNLYPTEPATSQAVQVTVAVPAAVTWDADTGTAGAQAGSGTWSLAATNWWNGTADVVWSNPNFATFGAGGAGLSTVTLADDVAASGLTFNGDYTLATTTGKILTLVGTAEITTTANAAIDAKLAGTSGMTKNGTGTLSLSAQASYTGGTVVNNGKLVLVNSGNGVTRISGALTVNSAGTVETNNGDSNGLGWQNQITSVAINGGMINFATNGHVWNITGGITMTGGTLQSNNGVNQAGNAGGATQLEWNKTNVTTLASPNTATIAGRINIRTDGGETGIVFNVADGAAATDLLVSAGIGQSGGAMAITKSGAGLMALTGTNTYGGTTTVNAGTLTVTGKVAGSTVILKDDTTLNITAQGGTSTIAPTGVVTVGSATATMNTINFTNLSSTTVAPLKGSNVNLDGPVTINIGSVTPVVGQYPLIKASGSLFVTSLTTGTLPSGITATVVDDSANTGSIYLDVTAVATPLNVWTGEVFSLQNSAWTIGGFTNWTINSVPAPYAEGNVVQFDDGATFPDVILNTTVNPSVVTFDHSAVDYTLSGSGTIAGATTLTKYGSGTVTISTANTYTGVTTISGGKLILLDAGASPLSGGIVDNATLEINATAAPVTYNTNITGTGTFTKSGTNSLTITGGLGLTTATTVAEGTLEMQTRSSDAPYVVNSGATLKLGYSTGGGYANTNLKLHGDGAAATPGLYLKGGTTYNVSDKMELLDAPTTLRQYGTGFANIGIFDVNGDGLICAVEASGSATDANIKFVSYGYGMSIKIAAGAATATGDFVLNGPLDVNAVGYGLFKRGEGSLRLNGVATANNKGLQIQGGTVFCGVAECIGANAMLVLSGTGKVDLNGFNQTVSTLTIAGIQQAAGTWGGTGSGAMFIDPVHFSGSGVVTVVVGPYATWAAANAGGQAAGLDYDKDGVTNGIEYFMGKTGSTFTANPAVVAGVVSWPKAASYVGVYGTDYVVQTSTNLSTWIDVPVGNLTSNGNPVQYTLPTGQPTSFTRLKVTGP